MTATTRKLAFSLAFGSFILVGSRAQAGLTAYDSFSDTPVGIPLIGTSNSGTELHRSPGIPAASMLAFSRMMPIASGSLSDWRGSSTKKPTGDFDLDGRPDGHQRRVARPDDPARGARDDRLYQRPAPSGWASQRRYFQQLLRSLPQRLDDHRERQQRYLHRQARQRPDRRLRRREPRGHEPGRFRRGGGYRPDRPSCPPAPDFTAGLDTFTLYVNPTPGGTQPLSGAVKSDTDVGTISSLSLYSTGAFSVDEIRIGTTYADVVPSAVLPIPEPSSLVLVTLGVLGVHGGPRLLGRGRKPCHSA